VNGHAERLFGHARQDLIRQPVTLLIPPGSGTPPSTA
jgi:hypothetical protein